MLIYMNMFVENILPARHHLARRGMTAASSGYLHGHRNNLNGKFSCEFAAISGQLTISLAGTKIQDHRGLHLLQWQGITPRFLLRISTTDLGPHLKRLPASQVAPENVRKHILIDP